MHDGVLKTFKNIKMKKKIIKKLILNKEDISNLSLEDANNLRGGNLAPTFVDPAHGGYCTNGCDGATFGPDNCTAGCTGPCPSAYGTGCPGGSFDNACSVLTLCFSKRNCTYTDCTNHCPTSYGDATCGC